MGCKRTHEVMGGGYYNHRLKKYFQTFRPRFENSHLTLLDPAGRGAKVFIMPGKIC
jgi:hypothetical protein